MTNWKMTINVSDFWKQEPKPEVMIFCKQLFDRLFPLVKKVEDSFGEEAREDYLFLLDEINIEMSAYFEDYDDFDYWLKDFYDFCDEHKIWFNTFK
jgi:glutathione peroxidase-family protein